MQKNKKNEIYIFLIILFAYGIFITPKLLIHINKSYLYLINPLFWILISITLKILMGKSKINIKIKGESIRYTLVASLLYIVIYIFSGFIITFGKNPYVTNAKGFFINIWIFGIAIVCKEYIRYILIKNADRKNKILVATLISIVYILIASELNRIFLMTITPLSIIKLVATIIIPLIVKNILYSYAAINDIFIISIIYEIITNLYIWISPILPNSPWVMSSIIDISIPMVLYIYIRYQKNKREVLKSKEKILNSDPKNIIPLIISVILVIWFAIGIFPIKPVAIATGSMIPELKVGDVAIIKKCKAEDIIQGDIIEYQMEGYTVIHRVINKKQKNGDYIFITKGDNNNVKDLEPVKEGQLIGKCIFKVRYLGYPAVYLHLIQTKDNVQVETGK